jgi:hypothetical protein
MGVSAWCNDKINNNDPYSGGASPYSYTVTSSDLMHRSHKLTRDARDAEILFLFSPHPSCSLPNPSHLTLWGERSAVHHIQGERRTE